MAKTTVLIFLIIKETNVQSLIIYVLLILNMFHLFFNISDV